MLLTDVFIIDNLTVLEESKTKGTMKIGGVFQRADEANNNKRVYSKHLLEREITKLADMIDNRRLLGELDHPSHDSVKLSNVSHLVTNLKMKGNEVLGEAELLNTPAGLTAQALIKGGVGIGISSRGLGTLSEGEDGTKNVNEDFKLVTFDLVADPSTRGAYPSLSESTETQEIYDRTMKQAISEKVFVQSLKEKLNEGIITGLASKMTSKGKLSGKIRRGAGKVSKVAKTGGKLALGAIDAFNKAGAQGDREGGSDKPKKTDDSTEFQKKYPNLNILIETKANTKKRSKRSRLAKLSPRKQGDIAVATAKRRHKRKTAATASERKDFTPQQQRDWSAKNQQKLGDRVGRAYMRSRKHAEHKKFGKPGETPWGTKKRLHGGGLSKANLTKKQADSIAVADREADKEKLAGPSGGSRRKR